MLPSLAGLNFSTGVPTRGVEVPLASLGGEEHDDPRRREAKRARETQETLRSFGLLDLPPDILTLVWMAIIREDCSAIYKLCPVNTQLASACADDEFWHALVNDLLSWRGEKLELFDRTLDLRWKRIYEVLCAQGTNDQKLKDASAAGDIVVVELMLGVGATNVSDALQVASKHGHAKIVQALLAALDEDDEDGIEVEGIFVDFSLLLAVRGNHTDVVQLLVNKGSYVDRGGGLALKTASEKGYTDIVRILLAAGANPNARRSEALRHASGQGHAEVVRVLLKNGANVHAKADEALEFASGQGHTDVVRVLLENGANVHANQDEALWSASFEGHTEIVEILLAAGANVNARDGDVLLMARGKGHTEVVALLEAAQRAAGAGSGG